MGIFEEALANTSRKPGGFSSKLERRREPRPPLLRSTHTSLTSHLWELELVPAIGLNRLVESISDLSKRSLDKNIFFENEVLLAAWPRLTSLLAPHGCWMLCLWETVAEKRSLQFFMPVRINKVGFPSHKVLQTLSNEFMPIGAPMVDSECSGEVIETLLRLLGDPCLGLPEIIDFTHLRETSKSYEAICEAVTNLGMNTGKTNVHQRAALFAKDNPEEFLVATLGKKRKRELARQLRKLADTAPVEFATANTEEDVLDAFESFMTLELKSWKGRRGTALYNHKKFAAFSRQIVAELASNNGCEIFTLKHGNNIIAALIMLGRDGHLVPWKMAFDENISASSPGMQVMLEATKMMVHNKNFIEADSLAISDHWMMNRVWPDRITILDKAIALTTNANSELESVVQAKNRLAKMRSTAKKIRNMLPL